MRKQSNESYRKNHNSTPVEAVLAVGAVNLSVSELVRITGVDPKTARRWRTGQQKIGPVAQRLIDLHRAGRVLPDSPDWRPWRFIGEELTWARNWAFDGERLRTLFYEVQNIPQLRAQLGHAREYIAYLEGLLPRAAVVPLENPRPGSAPVYTANAHFGQRADDSTPECLLELRRAGQL